MDIVSEESKEATDLAPHEDLRTKLTILTEMVTLLCRRAKAHKEDLGLGGCTVLGY